MPDVAEVEVPEGEVQDLTKGTVEEEQGEEEGKEGEAEEGEAGAEGEDKEEVDDREAEIQLLRQITREQKKELITLRDSIDQQTKVLKDKGILTEEDTKGTEEEKATLSARQGQLEFLAETMRVNPRYEDLDDVVSQEHFDDYVEAVAKAYVDKNGGNFDKILRDVETRVWMMPNPYKFLYGEIKSYHPAYRKAEGKDVATPDGKVKDIKVASSLSDIPGASIGKGGWSSAKIDALDESELGKVPPDVYDKYLKGELK